MNLPLTALFVFILTNSILGQESESKKIEQIDSLVSLIPDEQAIGSSFKSIEASGLIYKKKLILFKKRIGQFHELVIYKEKEIFSISIYLELENSSTYKSFYYNKGELIRYDKKSIEFNR